MRFFSRFGPPPASKQAIDALKKTHISEYKNTHIECCVCQELFKDSDDQIMKAEGEEMTDE